jgi:hypothetical protein
MPHVHRPSSGSPARSPSARRTKDARRVLPTVEVDEAAEKGAGEDLELGDLVHVLSVVARGANRTTDI